MKAKQIILVTLIAAVSGAVAAIVVLRFARPASPEFTGVRFLDRDRNIRGLFQIHRGDTADLVMQDVDGIHSVKLEVEPSGNAFIWLSQTNALAQLGVSTERAYLLLKDQHGEIFMQTDQMSITDSNGSSFVRFSDLEHRRIEPGVRR